VRLDDLPEADRRAVQAAMRTGNLRAQRATTPAPGRSTRRAAPVADTARVRCGKCGQTFDHMGVAVERHMDSEHHGGRIEMVLTDERTR
jgi:hypothetical protein